MTNALTLLGLLSNLRYAKLIEHQGDENPLDESGIYRSILPYSCHVSDHGKVGKAWQSDLWKHGFTWFKAVPEIVEFNGTIYFCCYWWNDLGGFGYKIRINKAISTIDGKEVAGYVIFKYGQGYTSNSKFFLSEDGKVYKYKSQVKSHEPVSYQPVGNYNVGWTETIISDDLRLVDDDYNGFEEILHQLTDSIRIMDQEKLRPIMENYFTLENYLPS